MKLTASEKDTGTVGSSGGPGKLTSAPEPPSPGPPSPGPPSFPTFPGPPPSPCEGFDFPQPDTSATSNVPATTLERSRVRVPMCPPTLPPGQSTRQSEEDRNFRQGGPLAIRYGPSAGAPRLGFVSLSDAFRL